MQRLKEYNSKNVLTNRTKPWYHKVSNDTEVQDG